MELIKRYIDGGGSVLVFFGEGGEIRFEININFLLEEYGIMINNGKCLEFFIFKMLFFGFIYCVINLFVFVYMIRFYKINLCL